MSTERPGDHPVSDIIVHGLEVYGPEADDLIRGIGEFSSKYELYEWWNAEVKGTTDHSEIAAKAQSRFQELFQRSNMSGWKST